MYMLRLKIFIHAEGLYIIQARSIWSIKAYTRRGTEDARELNDPVGGTHRLI